MNEEHVLCIPTVEFEAREAFNGFRPLSNRDDLGEYLASEPQKIALFVQRSLAESNPNLKQIVPYIAILSDDSIFTYQRGEAGGEPHLLGKTSIGIGGHVNTGDDPEEPFWAFAKGTIRELKEEVGMVEIDHNILQGAIVGLVNDDKTTVGKVHLGVCIILRVTREEAKALVVNCESTLANPQFVPVAQLSDPDFLREMETWSIYFAEHILNTHYTEGKWTDKAFVERVGMLAITSANLASSASGFLMQHSHHGHLVSKDMVEKSAGEVQCLLAGMIANEDIESHLVKKNAKEFHSMLPNILKHQPYRK